MRHWCSRKLQRGYLLEVPLVFAAVVILLAVLLPVLPPTGKKILLALGAIPILFALYYMIVTPGWMPGKPRRLQPPWNLMVFLAVAALLVGVVVMFLFGSACGDSC